MDINTDSNLYVNFDIIKVITINNLNVPLGGLGVTCSPRDPRFVASNTAEVGVFYTVEQVFLVPKKCLLLHNSLFSPSSSERSFNVLFL